ncbi:hypothetical protein MJH12_18705, partial [bacterium]|nr:hypothetical protein [bacterium]
KVNLTNLVQIDEALDVQGTASIANDEANFTIAKANADQNENAGAQTFTITRDKDTSQAQTVRWTVSGAEVNAADFGGTLPTNTVTFNAGELTKTISIDASSDTSGEANEAYDVTITDPGSTTGVKISASDKVSGSIINDDSVLNISVTSNTYTEGDSNSTFTFVVTRSGVTTGTASVKWNLSSQSSGLLLNDFVAGQDSLTSNGGFPSGTINWIDGETSKSVTVQVVGDLVVEDADTFRITLSSAISSDIATSTQDIVISKEDSSLALVASSAVKAEGDSGTTNYTFTINRTGDITSAGTVNYAVTGNSGLDASDFVGGVLPSGTLTLAANQTSTTLTIAVAGDTLAEVSENFTVTLSNASPTISLADATEVGTIQTDDIRFDVSGPTSNNLLEKDSGQNTDFQFTITRNGNLTTSQTVNWGVAGTGANGVSNAEFVATSGNVTFAANETSKLVTISTIGDIIGETNEAFRFTITAPSGSTTGTSFVDATLVENEAVLAIVSNQANVLEGADSTLSTHTFTVTRS